MTSRSRYPHRSSPNRPFAVYDHMVQKPPCWRANHPLGYPKQKNISLSCFVLDIPLGGLLSSMAVFVPCDRKLQRAHLSTDLWKRLINGCSQLLPQSASRLKSPRYEFRALDMVVSDIYEVYAYWTLYFRIRISFQYNVCLECPGLITFIVLSLSSNETYFHVKRCVSGFVFKQREKTARNFFPFSPRA